MRRESIHGRPRERRSSPAGSTCRTMSRKSSGIRQIVGSASRRALAAISPPTAPPHAVRSRGVLPVAKKIQR